MEPEVYYQKLAKITLAFTPGAPIQSRDLFAGRKRQIDSVISTILQRGQHVILYGERGVGKTSLANTLFDILVMAGKSNYHVARVNCSEQMNFGSMWRSIFRQIEIPASDGSTTTLDESLIGELPEHIREALETWKGDSIIIIDELDRIHDEETQIALADTIKTLSDNSVNTTLILVGVADSVDQLIQDHRSIDRNLMQVPMPRMSKQELLEVVDKGFEKCEMQVDRQVRARLADYAQGLPSFTHLLARESAKCALNASRDNVTMEDLENAIKESVNTQLQTNLTEYSVATSSSRGRNFKPVLLACALANKDDQGYFYAKDVIEPLRMITNKPYEIPGFARHLNAFCDQSRGAVLEKRGQRRKYKYRFVRPIMQPYVILRGLADAMIIESQLSRPIETASEPEQLWLRSVCAPAETGI